MNCLQACGGKARHAINNHLICITPTSISFWIFLAMCGFLRWLIEEKEDFQEICPQLLLGMNIISASESWRTDFLNCSDVLC
jgi:hypothetical protein